MVGDFGEVQVMDWGLAKVLDSGDSSAGGRGVAPGTDAVQTVRTAAHDHDTEAGSVLGTFDYMAPEQARGQLEFVDTRSDVIGLGAVLCEILTGMPPYCGPTREDVRRQALEGPTDSVRDRLVGWNAGAELTVLTLSCLARERESRPSSAGAVVKALEAHLAGLREQQQQPDVLRRRDMLRARGASSPWGGCFLLAIMILIPVFLVLYVVSLRFMRR
jgi:serine/threonine-protein kinase